MQDHQQIWETYTASWKAETADEKRELFNKSLAADCQYNDPLTLTKGWDELAAYMLDFHQQVQGGYFTTTYFLSHSNKSIARWDMHIGDGTVIGNGISYGEYNSDGKLTSMTGFYEPPAG